MLLLPYELTKASMIHFTPKLIRNLNVILIGILAWLCMSSVFAEGTVTPKQGILNSMSSLGQRFGLSAPDNTFLEPDRAFIFSADVKGANTIIAHWAIADGYYMYREKFVFKLDRKSTRLNSSHGYISYAVFCLKKKKNPFFILAKNAIHTSRSPLLD